MASAHQVKRYLAHWLQLGRKVVIQKEDLRLAPPSVFRGAVYSPEFEELWVWVSDPRTGDCYLEGDAQTVQTLLSPRWEIVGCARCNVPVPMCAAGQIPEPACACADMETWPNLDTLAPRDPVDNQTCIQGMTLRLEQAQLKPVPQRTTLPKVGA